MGSLRAAGGTSGGRQWVVAQDLRHPFPRHLRLLRAAVEPRAPNLHHLIAPARESVRVASDPEVPDVPAELLRPTLRLVLEPIVSVKPTPRGDALERVAESILRRRSLDHPVPLARACPRMGKTEQVERSGGGRPRGFRSRWTSGGSSERDQPGLLRVKRQPVPHETPRQDGQHAPSIAFVSEDESDSIGITNQERRPGEHGASTCFGLAARLSIAAVLPSDVPTPSAPTHVVAFGARSHGPHARCRRFAATVPRSFQRPRTIRFRLGRRALAGQDSNLLGRFVRFRSCLADMISSSPRLFLAHRESNRGSAGRRCASAGLAGVDPGAAPRMVSVEDGNGRRMPKQVDDVAMRQTERTNEPASQATMAATREPKARPSTPDGHAPRAPAPQPAQHNACVRYSVTCGRTGGSSVT
jgi:hypothetical protein